MFSERLRNTLIFKNISQAELAQNLGFTSAAINRWCQGVTQPDTETIVRIAKYLNVSTDFLLGNDANCSESENEIKEKIVLRNTLIKAGYMKSDEDLSEKELKKLMEFIKTNKNFIKNN